MRRTITRQMRLLLIRHGETVDNVAGNYAGVTDSPLTNHGVLQANRLGAHLATTNVTTACIFSSDLQRAFITADSIRIAQGPNAKPVVQLPVLREQDFGFYEGKKFIERPKDSAKNGRELHTDQYKDKPGFVDVESKESMASRAETFVDQHLRAQLEETPDDQAVVVVAHGIILNHLWRAILRRFDPKRVTMSASVEGADRGLEYLGGWSNTGYLELEVQPKSPKAISGTLLKESDVSLDPQIGGPTISLDITSAPAADLASPNSPQTSNLKTLNMTLTIKAVNSVEHLKNLKKTRGGIGSLKHDSKQRTMDSFFKKRKHEE